VRHVPFAPFTQLLPRCAALIHHGGIGTTSAAFAAGIPQVIMPLSHDQPDNAARVRALGVGDRLLPKHFTGRRLADVLRPLLASVQVKDRAADLARRCAAQDAIAETADLIERALPARQVANTDRDIQTPTV
jgi:UDP:flavonoid glycosyltransferase YjiC (YdhE family)